MSVKCPQCGAPADPQARNCKFCGESLSFQAAPNSAQQIYQQPMQPQPGYQAPPPAGFAPPQPNYQQPVYQTPPQYGHEQTHINGINLSWPEKSKVVAGVLAILLGIFGVHKFYLGRPVKGILYILFFWTYIPAIIGLVEGIIYLTQSEHNFQVNNKVRLPQNRYA